MSSLLSQIGIGASVILALTALGFGVYWLWRRAHRVLIGLIGLLIVAALIGLFEFFLPARYPTVDPALPVFRRGVWTWMLAFTLLALGTALALVRALLRRRNAGTDGGTTEHDPEIDAAWEAILLRLGQAEIDPTAQRFVLILAPDEAEVEALIHAAGLKLYAEAPVPGAPLRAHATAEAVLLSVAGACTLARQDASGTARLAQVCHLLSNVNPEVPVVRGVVTLFPVDWAARPEAPRWAAAVREDLRTINSILKVRPPVFAVLGRLEEIDGLNEFIARFPEAGRAGRCGFAIPPSATFSGELIGRGLAWLSGWFETWSLSLIAEDLQNTSGNGRLVTLTDEVRRRRKRWREVLEAAFSTHREAETVPLRGCYGVATGAGAGTGQTAFAAGLLRGARSRILADTITTDWADEAHDDDRVYRRAALAVGVVGGLLSLLAWSVIVQQHPFWWIILLVVVLAWITIITRMMMAR